MTDTNKTETEPRSGLSDLTVKLAVFWKEHRRMIVAIALIPLTVPFAIIVALFDVISTRLWIMDSALDGFFDWLSRDEIGSWRDDG
jgi:hypothetical protein